MDFYKFNVNTYKYPPLEGYSITLKIWTFHRIQKKWNKYIENKIIENKLRTYIILLKNEENSVTAKTTTLGTFFMCCELYWFITLYQRMDKEVLNEFLTQNDFCYSKLSLEEKEMLKNKLITSSNIKSSDFCDMIYYKVNFTEVIKLVETRKVFLYKGFAYLPESDIIYCVQNRLWRQFNRQLEWTGKILPTALKEQRIQNLLSNLPLVKPTTKFIDENGPKLTLDNINEAVEVHFPLCIKSIHEILRKNHHLKYDCKMQYGIFLKCSGFEYEDAMVFWRDEFTQKMDTEQYDKKYLYLFKHQYGKVGSRLDYKPYSCQQIQSWSPGPLQHHGCPFKHWDIDKVLKRCENDGLNNENVGFIRNYMREGKYAEACTTYFSASHRIFKENLIESPNQYFEESCKTEGAIDAVLDVMFERCDNDLS
ncbi:hypothetical protein NQ317_015138 [Molorchus minor]|uniref:DNA primase large subunit C-terminal domain-containing protein n=1 Tax=Molorchus minor TaxID=1323400 RepID=A0ABQ9K7Y6_9CUCU|nr:hypothetical protein NQ317_015138 [Molorchus minor]